MGDKQRIEAYTKRIATVCLYACTWCSLAGAAMPWDGILVCARDRKTEYVPSVMTNLSQAVREQHSQQSQQSAVRAMPRVFR